MSKKNQELAAAKAKKQKTILIVGGVLLLAVAAFQGPKLLKHGSTSDAAPAATSVATGTTPATATPTSTGGAALIPVAAAVPKGSASIAGVALPNATVVKVTTSQLASFTLFEAKDPFVQQEGGETGTAAQPQGEAPSSASGEPGSPAASGPAGTTPTGGSSASGSAEGSAPAAPAPVTYATITFNGSAQQVQAKDKFPVDAPL